MTDTTQMLDDALHRLLSRRLPDAMARNTPDLSETLMAEILENGFALVLASEENGGLNGTVSDAATVAWRCGWHAASIPIVEMLLLPLVDPTADPASTTLAHGTPAMAPCMAATTTIHTGCATMPATDGDPFQTITGANWGVLNGTTAIHDETTLATGALLTAAVITGVMARTLGIVTEYATSRTQFGRPLSKFQAIQHQLAEATSELTITEAALASALNAHDSGKPEALLLNSAKSQAATAATKIAAVAHQVMGAIGFTEEHELHHFTKLLWQLRDSWGRQTDCDIAIGIAACVAPDGLWPFITDTQKETP